ncbi:MAG: cysteine hydrolase family protein [Deltaproteobacteria bacterium]|nr:cysteine hydrolase family protein [Deltaproteobacteria bacterium]
MKDALIIVDMQNDYFSGGRMELIGMETAAENVRELLAFYRTKQTDIFHIQHLSLRKEAGFFLPDTRGAKIHEALTPSPDETVVTKHYPNSFRETALLEILETDAIGQLTICGAMSHMCIDATTRAAFDLGFRCRVVTDACATRDLIFEGETIPAASVHGAFMAALSPIYAALKTTREITGNA